MSYDTQFFELLERRIRLSIHTIAPARVISFNELKRTANVELLFLSVDRDGDTEKYAPILDAPVLGMRYKNPEELEMIPYLKKGDVVFVGFAERAIDNLRDKPFDPEYSRTHDVRDAVVLGVLF